MNASVISRNAASKADRAQSTARADTPDPESRLRLLFLTSSLLTERMLIYSSLLDRLTNYEVNIWTSSASPALPPVKGHVLMDAMPTVEPFPEFPYMYLRRLNDFAWDGRLESPSRQSMMQHVRDQSMSPMIRALRGPAAVLTRLRLEGEFESWLERLLLSYERSTNATLQLQSNRPTVVITTGPQRFEEPAIVASAKRLGIPTLALITSWDNITTKNRIPFKHDGYLVWSEQMRAELVQFYPDARSKPVYVVGAPQFDVFFQDRFREDRKAFCLRAALRPELPIILYALGSPNFLKEHYGAVALAECVQRGDLGDVQLLIRPHPLFADGNETQSFQAFGPRVKVQRTAREALPTAVRSQNEADIVEWVSTFRHADVVVNLSSTATIDAAISGKPVVNLDYDPEPGRPNAALVHDVNHVWTHFKPIAESGGVALAHSLEEMVQGILRYLANPQSDADKRRWIAEYVCGFLDGQCGARLADAVVDFARQRTVERAS